VKKRVKKEVSSMDAEKMVADLTQWLRDQTAAAGAKGGVVGLSGGLDSSVVAALCCRAFGENCLGLILPCYSHPQDAEHAWLVARHLNMPAKEIPLDEVYDRLVFLLTGQPYREGEVDMALANLKPRLRMAVLYFFANRLNYLVIGTDNLSEWSIGYFTKYGDGGVDLLPLANLVKSEVRELARYLGLPPVIIEKPPTAGLWPGQTDEGEMGFSYEVLDRYLRTREAPPEVKEKIERMMAASEHKRRPPLRPPF